MVLLVNSVLEGVYNRTTEMYKVIVERYSFDKAFKAGNMNHGLEHFAHEEYFAIADADEILPRDVLKKLVPVRETDEKVGFVQANHRANPKIMNPT